MNIIKWVVLKLINKVSYTTNNNIPYLIGTVYKGLVAAIVSAILATALLIIGCMALYMYLLQVVPDQFTAILYSVGLLIFIFFINICIILYYICKLKKLDTKLLTLTNTVHTLPLTTIFKSFINGLCDKSTK